MRNKLITFLMTIVLLVGSCLGATTQSNLVSQEKKNVDIHFISTGNSDAILIKDNGKMMLVDGAENDDEKDLVAYLKEQNVKKLDYVVLTHPDADHCGALDSVIKNFEIGTVLIGNGSADTKTYKDFVNAAINKNIKPSVPLDAEFTLGEGKFKFYNQKSQSKDVNDRSLVMLYTFGEKKFLFNGDAGVEVEKVLPLKEIGKVDVLKVGHHGSKTSSSDTFIKSIEPKVAIICCGKDNKYGHPNKETLDTLSKYKAKVYRTDINGGIILKTDGKEIKINTTTAVDTNKNAMQQVTTITQNNTTTTDSTVYITKTGKKYHKDGCSSLSSSKIKSTVKDAKAKGLTPCDKCKP
ncbi:MBL fold hydrolase [Sporanaerobium hydrogeniformans]|uniref:MBL fold hydrolase n=1 Tax=Sporanaerobium hydrogeniformans TaxID=3072179 RepID=A0AC61DFF4_9FIRM|nr:ComEC/Rec2 family competence protein [Sporanaerobium hydrogeniformans]PHV71926.1 MBL fold hydrolase [Sporanaerobium hydrogeniformans]